MTITFKNVIKFLKSVHNLISFITPLVIKIKTFYEDIFEKNVYKQK